MVRDTLGRESDRQFGRGLNVELGASVGVSRATFTDNREGGIAALDSGTTLVLNDVLVRATQAQESDGGFGAGLSVENGAAVDASRAVFDRNHALGVNVTGAGTTLRLADIVVSDTQPRESEGGYGTGMNAWGGAQVDGTRVAVLRNRADGVVAYGAGTTFSLTDAVITDTTSDAKDGRFGRALDVSGGARLSVMRGVFERNQDLGVFAADLGTLVTLTDVVVDDTLGQICEATGSCDWVATSAVGAHYGAHVDARRFIFAHSALMGVQLHEGGTADLHEGEISGCPIGANVQTEGFDVGRLADRVVYHDNGVNLDGSALPVPQPGDPLGP
jgi:hypothetical protein